MPLGSAAVDGAVRRSPTPPSISRCNVSKINRLRVHLNVRLFSPLPPVAAAEAESPLRVENLSLGESRLWGAGNVCMCKRPWWDGNIATREGLARVASIMFPHKTTQDDIPENADNVNAASESQANLLIHPRPAHESTERWGGRLTEAHA